MLVKVRKGDVIYFCKSQEQLDLFINAGYVIVEDEAKPKKTTKKTASN